MINWKIRYSRILASHPELFDGSLSVLEVGSGDRGVAQYVKRKVTGLEPRFGPELDPWLDPVTGSIFEIPFPEGHFDLVLCVDVFEHLPAGERPRALGELLRVARRKTIVSCPCDPIAAEGERHLAELFRGTPYGIPQWLAEHFQHGLPSVGSMVRAIHDTGLRFEIEGNEGMLQHYGGILLDHFFPIAGRLSQLHDRKSLAGAPLGRGAADLYYSYIYTIHGRKEGTPAGPSVSALLPQSAEVSTADAVSAQSPRARVYCVTHKGTAPESLGNLVPIFAGPVAQDAPGGAVTDIPRVAPRLRNSRWSELSAMYRIWRDGQRTPVVGFCHYRRLFDFRPGVHEARETVIASAEMPAHANDFFDAAVIDSATADAIIVPPQVRLEEPSVWHQYCVVHDADDWCRILGKLSARHPHLVPYSLSQFDSPLLYANNMFILRWERFDELCRLWFDVLGEFEQEVPVHRGSAYQDRDVSFLAERLFDIWLRYRVDQGTRLIETPIFFVRDA